MRHSATLYVIDRGTRDTLRYVECLCGWSYGREEVQPGYAELIGEGRLHIERSAQGIDLVFLDGGRSEAWSEPDHELVGDGERSRRWDGIEGITHQEALEIAEEQERIARGIQERFARGMRDTGMISPESM